jgi:hypothetical protein
VSGLVQPVAGQVFFDGKDITRADAVATATQGIVQVPGGKAVFPTLTVAEHFKVGAWLFADEDPAEVEARTQEVLGMFPRLRERWDQMAGNLSGGEQQQLALGMAFVAKPKLLIIDELSLGLRPTVVGQLLEIVRKIHATAARSSWSSSPSTWRSPSRPRRTSWRRARSASPARPPSCSSATTSCARSSCTARARAWASKPTPPTGRSSRQHHARAAGAEPEQTGPAAGAEVAGLSQALRRHRA